jgi:hypothetical protein
LKNYFKHKIKINSLLYNQKTQSKTHIYTILTVCQQNFEGIFPKRHNQQVSLSVFLQKTTADPLCLLQLPDTGHHHTHRVWELKDRKSRKVTNCFSWGSRFLSPLFNSFKCRSIIEDGQRGKVEEIQGNYCLRLEFVEWKEFSVLCR